MTRDQEPGRPAEAGGPSPAPPSSPVATLEFVLAPEDLLGLARFPGSSRSGPSRPVNVVWHDNAEGALAADGMALVRDGRVWRLERLRPGRDADWLAAAPAGVLDEDASPSGLRPTPPFDCAPAAALVGRRRTYALAGAEVEVLYGTVRASGGSAGLPGGPDGAGFGAGRGCGRVGDRAAGRGAAGYAGAGGARGGEGCAVPARHLGAPSVAGDASVSDGLAVVISHLLDVLLHWGDRCRTAAEPEAVHQARVATRRLRSALSIYKRATASSEFEALNAGLRECATRLGAARDWDVFLEGTGARLAEGDPDPRVTLLLRTAQRRRNEAYAELRTYLASPGFRALELGLACAAVLRPWDATGDRPRCVGPPPPSPPKCWIGA